jgi:hypothetical protein
VRRPITTRAQYEAGLKRIKKDLEQLQNWEDRRRFGGSASSRTSSTFDFTHAPFEAFNGNGNGNGNGSKPAASLPPEVDPLENVQKACKAAKRANASRLAAIQRARESGLTLAAIAKAAGVTAERVRQLTTA